MSESPKPDLSLSFLISVTPPEVLRRESEKRFEYYEATRPQSDFQQTSFRWIFQHLLRDGIEIRMAGAGLTHAGGCDGGGVAFGILEPARKIEK
jgi:hypothetical protein